MIATVSKRPLRLGEILVQLGRATPEQVELGLEHQRVHGGFLGSALITLGILTREELRWCLADQHDIPFVRLRPEQIDAGLAARIPAGWARKHSILPVLRSGDRVTAVLADLENLERLETVRRMTGAAVVEAALASPEAIAELIDNVFGPSSQPSTGLRQLLDDAMSHGAGAVGVSVRDGVPLGWYRLVETVSRPLLPGWETELTEVLSPLLPLAASASANHRTWPALLAAADRTWRVDCSAIGQGRALEWVARIVAQVGREIAGTTLGQNLPAELRAALRTGSLLLSVRSPEGVTADDSIGMALQNLPALVLGSDVRSIHLSDVPMPSGSGTVTVHIRGSLADELEGLAAFAPTALTVDVTSLATGDEAALRAAAPFVAIRIRGAAPSTALSYDREILLCQTAGEYSWSFPVKTDAED